MSYLKRLLSLWALLLIPAGAAAQTFEGIELVKARLTAEQTTIVPGKPFTVGLVLEIAPGWHTYWEYAGDSGLPTAIDWSLPPGFSAGPIQWPLPTRFVEPGDLVTYAYADEVLLFVEITPPAQIAESTVTLRGDAKWLVCKQSCVLGGAELSLTLPVGSKPGGVSESAELFAKYRPLLPKSGATPFNFTATGNASATVFEIAGLPAEFQLEFFPLPGKSGVFEHPKVEPRGDGQWSITVPRVEGSDPPAGPLRGVLVTSYRNDAVAPREGWLMSAEQKKAPVAAGAPATAPAASGSTLLRFLGLGFLGGLILNLMPCVLPVIALKIFGFMKQAGDEPGKIFRLGLAFIAGIFAWFLGLAAIVAIFNATGRELNWAFQFQNPYCLVAMLAVVFLFALNLLGVFEITLSSDASSKLSDLSGREGYSGAFFHGLFTTLLGTSCTAPFLGPALGFAFVQPPFIIFTVFASIAAGMSFPYFLLTARPAWMKYLPKPGIWMERVKQFMGFLLLAVALWLLWTLGRQRGVDDLTLAACFLLGLSVAAWVKGSFVHGASSTRSRRIGALAIVVIVAASFFAFVSGRFTTRPNPPKDAGTAPGAVVDGIWKPYSTAALQEALDQNKVVFVDFTADWCLNCKVNERFVLDTDAIHEAFARGAVVTLKADYTNRDPEITRILKSFGRIGVPLYVVYRRGQLDNPIVLPELLTKAMVLEALRDAGATQFNELATSRGAVSDAVLENRQPDGSEDPDHSAEDGTASADVAVDEVS